MAKEVQTPPSGRKKNDNSDNPLQESKRLAKSEKTQSTVKPPVVQDNYLGREIVGVLLMGLGLLLGLSVYTNAAAGAGLWMKNMLLGLFGLCAYASPPLFLWLGFLTIFTKKRKVSWFRVCIWSLIGVMGLCFLHLFWAGQVPSDSLGEFVVESFLLGRVLSVGTGAVGGLLLYPLYMTMGVWGSGILYVTLMLIGLMVMTRLSLRAVGEKAAGTISGQVEELKQWRNEKVLQYSREIEEEWPEHGPSKKRNLLWMEDHTQDKRKKKRHEPEKGEPIPSRNAQMDWEVPEFVRNSRRREVDYTGQRETDDMLMPKREEMTPFDILPDLSLREARELPWDGVGEAEADAAWLPDLREMGIKQEEQNPQDGLYPSEDTVTGILSALQNEMHPLFEDEHQDEGMLWDGQGADAKELPDDGIPPPIKGTQLSMKVNDERSEPIAMQSLSVPAAYRYPPLSLLQVPIGSKNRAGGDDGTARKLEETLASFGVEAKVLGVTRGPAITRYELAPAPGVKVSRIVSLADDIALNLAAIAVRIEAPIPGKAAIGIEIPNDTVASVSIREILEGNYFQTQSSKLTCVLGMDISGRHVVGDIAKMPHTLIAGATGSGKSVCINTLITSILYKATPDEVRLIMIDPKVVELSVYNGIPHLLIPVVTDPKKAASALNWAVAEMTERYKKFAERGVRDMAGFNKHLEEDEAPLPQIVIIIDELADLMMVAPGEVEDAICRLAQLARAAGIHLVIATQRPSVNVITGVIKANIPSRIAFAVASQVDSRTILDVGGAEKLLGKGDMLYLPSGQNKATRVQGAWVSDAEVQAVVDFIKQDHIAAYNEDILEKINEGVLEEAEEDGGDVDELMKEAIELAVDAGQTSISMLQRRLRIGYARAGRLVDGMTKRGIVSEAEGAKPRNTLITREEFRRLYEE